MMKRDSDVEWNMVMRHPHNPNPKEDPAPRCYGPYKG